MLLREVSYARPSTVEEAVSLLTEHDGARALAGGQTLVNVMKQRAASPDVLVDLADLDELRAISVSGTTLEIGAMATLAAIMRSSEVDVSRPIPDLWPQFDALAGVPLMLIRGVNTDLLSSETVTAMRERRPDLHVMEVPGQGHAPLLTEDDIIGRIGQFAALCDRQSRASPPEPGRRPPRTT